MSQQPIGLKGHTRSITCVQYNRDSDLLFTCAKDSTPTLWYTGNGERVGTFNGHTGANTKLHVSGQLPVPLVCATAPRAKLCVSVSRLEPGDDGIRRYVRQTVERKRRNMHKVI